MKFSYFETTKAQRGAECTYDLYLEKSNEKWLLVLCNKIAQEENSEKRGRLKKQLPVITWQAYFPGKRVNKEAEPSGLFMLDIDHVENPHQIYSEKIASRVQELGIVYVGKTASCKGLRIVAKCRRELHTIEECQRWLASNLKVEYDAVCKDWARSSYMVHDSYTYYMDAGAIWLTPAEEGTIYENKPQAAYPNMAFEEALHNGNFDYDENQNENENENTPKIDQREGLFGGGDSFKGMKYSDIMQRWLEHTGGEPTEGERNTRLHKLAMRMRYITDFNEATLLRIMPTYGLQEDEMKSLIHSACSMPRASNLPRDLEEVLDKLSRQKEVMEDNEEDPELITPTAKMPPMPPVIRQFVECAPEDFKAAVALCQLPILGALGSRLRAKYLDGVSHSPSFLVSLEAPQASGKSFLTRITNYELRAMMDHDETERAKEREYDKKVKELRLLNVKVTVDNKEEVLGSRPQTLIRYLPPTISVTKLLQRMDAAQGLHLFAIAVEIDTVTKAFKRSFSSFSDLLRVSFDNDLYGQDYASENSFSGNINIYYNFLSSGTPKAMRRFYPDVEDGLVSRVCFVTLPDQFGKSMPQWKEFTPEQKQIVDLGLERLNEISIQGDTVQPEHMMKLDWLNKELKKWIEMQQAEAIRTDDRTRDVFCRRAAVVGFRAGLLAWYLYGETNTPTIRKNVIRFATWVSNMMLNQHLLRFNVQNTNSNVNHWEELYKSLGNEFTRAELEDLIERQGIDSKPKVVIYKWKLLGIIEAVESGRGKRGQQSEVKFRKLK